MTQLTLKEKDPHQSADPKNLRICVRTQTRSQSAHHRCRYEFYFLVI